MKSTKQNYLIRGCFKKNEKLDSLVLSKASIILFFNAEKTFAYGVGINSQGGGSFGEYHIIGHNQEGKWKFNAGNYKPFDGFYEEMSETASEFKGFNVDDAKRIIEDYDDYSLYYYFEMLNRTVDSYELEDAISDNDKDFLGFDEYFCADEEGEYYESKFAITSELKQLTETDGYLWYNNDKLDDDLKSQLNECSAVQNISKLVPGNIEFIK